MRRRQEKPVTRERRVETPGTSTGQLSWLVAAILLTGAPHLLHVHPWVPIVVISILFWRVIAALKRWSLPGTLVRVSLTLFGFLGVLFSYRQVSGLSAGSALLLIMAAMKLLETRGHRDRAIVIFICYFLLFATFLREQAIWSAAYLVIVVLVTTSALFQTARIGPVVPAPFAMAQTTRLVLQSLPVALLLFLLFPRIPGPFWSLPHTGDQAVAGLSGELNPGDISELALSDKVAFRVRFDSAPPGTFALYWRGPVMDDFDGRKWTQWQARQSGTAGLPKRTGAPIDYEVTLEPHGQRWLLALETPLAWDARGARLSANGQLLHDKPIDRRMSYRSTSILGASREQNDNPIVLDRNRALPANGNPRSIAFGRQLRATVVSDAEYLEKLLQYFSTEPFYYTLRPPSLGDNPIDEFLFATRRGFCGHFASAFTVLARAGGIPARVVTGYQGAEQNPLGNYWIVRQSDAHAWTEVWIDGRWLRFDPTAMVAPDRIEYGFDEAMERRDGSSGRLANSELFERIAMSWDALNTGWNRWVLSFGPETQSTIMSLIGIRHPSIENLVITMAVSVTALLILIGLIQRYRAQPRPDGLLATYNRLCQRTGKVVRDRRPAEGPHEYLAAMCAQRPDLATELRRLFGMYVQLRYDGIVNEQLRRKFFAAVRVFRPTDQTAAG
jgi:transglutaminase-like putative cysteine protease